SETASDDDWLRRCESDVQITSALVEAILALVRENSLGNFRLTGPAQALAAWRHGRLDCEVTLSDDQERKVLERDCYFGGRNLVYFSGHVLPAGMAGLTALAGVKEGEHALYEAPVYRLDATAAYPSVMLDNLYPVKYVRREERITPGKCLDYLG